MEFCKNPFVYMEVGNVLQVTMRRKEERSIENAAAILFNIHQVKNTFQLPM